MPGASASTNCTVRSFWIRRQACIRGGMWCAISPARLPGSSATIGLLASSPQAAANSARVLFAATFPTSGCPIKSACTPRARYHSCFKRKNAKPAHEPPAHQVRAPRPPGPELRAHEIDVLHALALQRARQAQVKSGEIGENREARFAPRRLRPAGVSTRVSGRDISSRFRRFRPGILRSSRPRVRLRHRACAARPCRTAGRPRARATPPPAAPRTCLRTLRRRR